MIEDGCLGLGFRVWSLGFGVLRGLKFCGCWGVGSGVETSKLKSKPLVALIFGVRFRVSGPLAGGGGRGEGGGSDFWV